MIDKFVVIDLKDVEHFFLINKISNCNIDEDFEIHKKLITLSNLSKTKIIMINKIIDKSNVMSKIESKTFENLKRLIIKIKILYTKRSIKKKRKR